MNTLVQHPALFPSLSAALPPGEAWAVLCVRCERDRSRSTDPDAPELVMLGIAVVSGCCHDCGGGFCLCRGQLLCDRCPRKNSPVIIDGLAVYRLRKGSAPVTIPAPIG